MPKMLSAIDVLAICPLDIEFEEIGNALVAHGFKVNFEEPIHHQCKSMIFARNIPCMDLPSILIICVLQTRHQGILRTACTATDLIAKLRPKLVISFGIAGLFDSADYRLGDVCVPESIFYYEPAKDAGVLPTKKRTPIRGTRRAARENSSHRLHAPIIYSTNQTDYQHPTGSERFRVVLDRPIASGEKLIAAVGSLAKAEALDMHRQMIGVEMEAAGVAEACRSTPIHRRPKFIAIKGFSDLATAKSKNPTNTKGQQDQQSVRRRAAQNAATQLAKFLHLNHEAIGETLSTGRYLDSARLTEQTQRLKAIVHPSSTIEYFPEDLRLQRPLLVGAVPVIYHFTVGRDGIVSWVDLYFLLVQKKIRDEFGFCPHIFISEPSDDAPNFETKHGINELLDRFFGGRTYILYWSSDIQRYENLYRHYAERSRAVHPGFFALLKDTDHSTSDANWTKHKTDRWLVFIIWLSRVLPVQLILAFDRRRELYEKLKFVPGLDPTIIYGKTLRLAESDELSSRFSARIKTLGVNSNSIAPMLDWFINEFGRSRDDALSIIDKFVKHYRLFVEISDQHTTQQKSIAAEFASRSGIALGDYRDAIMHLAGVLCFIESSFSNPARH